MTQQTGECTYETLSEDEFWEKYQPLTNHLDNGGGFDGCLFETYGAELEHVHKQAPNTLWTMIEEDEGQWIISGYHLVNRMGYLVTRKPWQDHAHLEIQLDD